MRPVTSGFIALSLTALLGSLAVDSSHALPIQLSNAGFETGDFSGWGTIGNTSIQTAAFGSGPAEGTYQALLQTANSASSSALSTFLGSSIDIFDPSFHGSAIRQKVTLNQGDTFLLDSSWNFLTNNNTTTDSIIPFLFTDFFFASPLLAAAPPLISSATPFRFETGFTPLSFGFTYDELLGLTGGANTFTLAYGIVAIDGFPNAGLLVDNAPVPEPGTFLLVGAGLLGLGFIRKQFKG